MVIAVGAVFALVLGLIISNGISKPITKVVAAAGKLAEGDMDITFDINSKDETGKLVDAFRNLVESTKKQAFIVEKIADGDLTVDVPIRSKRTCWDRSCLKWCTILTIDNEYCFRGRTGFSRSQTNI